jgi:hypothetical protein
MDYLTERVKILEDELSYLKEKDIENRALIAKMFENNEKILKSFVYKNQETDKQLSLIFNFIINMCDPEVEISNFLISHAIDIYNCDKNLFCKILAKDDIFTTSCPDVFKLLFLDIPYEELNNILEEASLIKELSYSKWFKLNFLRNLVIQGYKLDLNENDKNIYLLKMHKMFTETDVSSCPHPYNSKDQFIKNAIFKISLNHALVVQSKN